MLHIKYVTLVVFRCNYKTKKSFINQKIETMAFKKISYIADGKEVSSVINTSFITSVHEVEQNSVCISCLTDRTIVYGVSLERVLF